MKYYLINPFSPCVNVHCEKYKILSSLQKVDIKIQIIFLNNSILFYILSYINERMMFHGTTFH